MMRRLILSAVLTVPGFVMAGENTAQRPAPDFPRYQSALQDYQPFADQPIRNWREVIEEVGKRGGWKSYAKESAEARQAEVKASEAGAKP